MSCVVLFIYRKGGGRPGCRINGRICNPTWQLNSQIMVVGLGYLLVNLMRNYYLCNLPKSRNYASALLSGVAHLTLVANDLFVFVEIFFRI